MLCSPRFLRSIAQQSYMLLIMRVGQYEHHDKLYHIYHGLGKERREQRLGELQTP